MTSLGSQPPQIVAKASTAEHHATLREINKDLDALVDRARAHEPMGDDGLGLPDPPRPVTGLILDRRVPPPVVEHDVVGVGEVQAGAAGLQ